MANRGFATDHPRLSLLAQFDDITRCTQQLTVGIEEEFKQFAQSQKNVCSKWLSVMKQVQQLENEVQRYKKERDAFETKWKHLKNLMDIEMQKRHKVEEEKKSLEKLITLIKEILLGSDAASLDNEVREKLAFLDFDTQPTIQEPSATQRRLGVIEESVGSLSVLSSSDVSFDKTDDDPINLEEGDQKYVTRRSKSKRSYADHKKIADKKKPKLDQFLDDDQEDISLQSKISQYNASDNAMPFMDGQPVPVRTEAISTPLRRCSSGRMNRNHAFCSKTIIRPETCNVCGHRIGFYKQAQKCNNCRVTCHPECKNNAPIPCYPNTRTPTNKLTQGTIADYAPSSPPMVPALLFHCINEIDARGMNEVGLYRISGSEREVKELKEKLLRGKTFPTLDKIDIHAVCGTVKEFLRSLQEPLLTRALWKEFANASQIASEREQFSAIKEAVSKLPPPNRDTLAFLMVHLKSVCESPDCKMPIENLATVFGPTIVGYSVDDPSDADMLIETKYQSAVMCALLRAPLTYWQEILDPSIDADTLQRTPNARLEGSRLGPLTNSRGIHKSRSVTLGRSPFTPRGTPARSIKSKRFFVSPLLK